MGIFLTYLTEVSIVQFPSTVKYPRECGAVFASILAVEVSPMDLNTSAYNAVTALTSENKGDKDRISRSRRSSGRRGGAARAVALSPERRREIAVEANRARWLKK